MTGFAGLLDYGAVVKDEFGAVLAVEGVGDGFKVFFGEGVAFDFLVEVGWGHVDFAGEFGLADAFVGEEHFDFLLYGHCIISFLCNYTVFAGYSQGFNEKILKNIK